MGENRARSQRHWVGACITPSGVGGMWTLDRRVDIHHDMGWGHGSGLAWLAWLAMNRSRMTWDSRSRVTWGDTRRTWSYWPHRGRWAAWMAWGDHPRHGRGNGQALLPKHLLDHWVEQVIALERERDRHAFLGGRQRRGRHRGRSRNGQALHPILLP